MAVLDCKHYQILRMNEIICEVDAIDPVFLLHFFGLIARVSREKNGNAIDLFFWFQIINKCN